MKNGAVDILKRIVGKIDKSAPLRPAPDDEWKKTREYELFLTRIREVDSAGLFCNKMQVHGTVAVGASVENLADWTVHRAIETDAETAIGDTVAYLQKDTYPATAVMLIAGTYVEKRLRVDDHVAFIDPRTIDNGFLQRSLDDTFRNALPIPKVFCAIVHSCDCQRLHISGEDEVPTNRWDHLFQKLVHRIINSASTHGNA